MSFIPRVQFLITDYNRPEESLTLLRSLKKNVTLERGSYWITFLSNGGEQDEVSYWYKEGLIDQLVVRNRNLGGSWAMRDLAFLCQSDYAFLLQNDQFLLRELTDNDLGYFISALENYKCIDLAGDVCQGKYSDRAQFVRVKDYREWIADCKHYGPGPTQHLGQHNEGVIQDLFIQNNWQILHLAPLFFGDNGCMSVRELSESGGISCHRTDTKQLWWIERPMRKGSTPNLNDEEWALSIRGEWIGGTIPEADRIHSFQFWSENKERQIATQSL